LAADCPRIDSSTEAEIRSTKVAAIALANKMYYGEGYPDWPGRASNKEGESWISIAGLSSESIRQSCGCGRGGWSWRGEIDTTEAATRKLVAKLAAKYRQLTFCYEAGPTRYGLYRLIRKLGHDCIVAAPSLIPKKPPTSAARHRRKAVPLIRGSGPPNAD
jgi:hypothetical protein